MALTQDQRQFIITSPLEKDALLFYNMRGSEELGRLFRYELDLLSTDANINLDDVLGKQLTVALALGDGNKRYFNGYASSFRYMGMQEDHHLYKATLRPWLWFLTRSADCRIFQNKTFPDIIKQVFRDSGYSEFEDQLSGDYRQWDYCVQYRETAFNFVSRLMEQEGIYYYFRHEQDVHTLVLADSIAAHSRNTAYDKIPYYPPQQQERREGEYVDEWYVSKGVESQRYALSDFDFTKPRSNLEVRESIEDGFADLEVFDYPGEYSELEAGQAAARARAEQFETHYERINAKGNLRALNAGDLFELTNYPRGDQNKEYLLLTARFVLHSDLYRSARQSAALPDYRIVLTAMDSVHPYRSALITPQPTVKGPQTAIVVGPEGEKVWVDDYGRVKVQFHWDRYGQKDENSSCWVRVSQNWAGKNWGGLHIPHIGQEVIVDFLEGDPDRPLITGRVYNADNMPPKDLPNDKNKSIIRDDFGNELVFDATPGDEHIRLYSPHHNSGLILGRSSSGFTESDDNSFKFGNTTECGLGTKSSAYLGSVHDVSMGFNSSLFAGLNLNWNIGGAYNFNAAWDTTTTFGPISEYTFADILSLSGQDHILGAGDQLCLIGGSAGTGGWIHGALRALFKQKQAMGRSIVNLYPNKLTLSVGDVVKDVSGATFAADKQLYPGELPHKWQDALQFGILTALSVVMASLSLDQGIKAVSQSKDSADAYNIGVGAAGTATGLLTFLYLAIRFIIEKANADKIEPVEHTEPNAQIRLDKNGEISLQSKDNKITIVVGTPEKAKIVIDNEGKIDVSAKDVNFDGDGVIDMKAHEVKMGNGKMKIDGNTISVKQTFFKTKYLSVG